MSVFEWFGAGFGLLSVVLLALNWRCGWLAQNASSVFYIIVFWQSKLLILAGLQVFFITIATWAWWRWNANANINQLAVKRINLRQGMIWFLICLAGTFALAWALKPSGTAAPYTEGFLASASMVAQWLMGRHFIETWIVWALVNALSIFLYWQSDLQLTAALYALFLVLAAAGFVQWKKTLAQTR